jgi:hypothetical protein
MPSAPDLNFYLLEETPDAAKLPHVALFGDIFLAT